MHTILLPDDLQNFKIHMIGIKGTGMTALAELLVSRGASVCGSDVEDEFYTDSILQKLGIKIKTPFSPSNINEETELIIYSSAYSTDSNEELAFAEDQRIPCLSYPEALGEFSKLAYSCGICGVHGKTTTTGMAGTILKALKLEASVLTGSQIPCFGSSCVMTGGSKYFVAETCEYKQNFLHFSPQEIVLTSIEHDHQDYYKTYEEILSAFLSYMNKLPKFAKVFYCADDKGACEAVNLLFSGRPDLVLTGYGENAAGEYRIKMKGIKDGKQYFSLAGFAGEFYLPIPGKYNVLNAAAAAALCISLLKKEKGEICVQDLGIIRRALASYTGAKRRGEIVGVIKSRNILILDDYAHHPTAIKVLLKGLREFYPGRRIVADFMAHTYSRTEALLMEFSSAFKDADIVILHKIYSSAREVYNGQISADLLYSMIKKKHKNVYFFNEILEAQDFVLKSLKDGDIFITIGAGDNWKLGSAVLKKME